MRNLINRLLRRGFKQKTKTESSKKPPKKIQSLWYWLGAGIVSAITIAYMLASLFSSGKPNGISFTKGAISTILVLALLAILIVGFKWLSAWRKSRGYGDEKKPKKKGDKRWIATATQKIAELVCWAVALAALTMGVSYTLIAKSLTPSYADMKRTAEVLQTGAKKTGESFRLKNKQLSAQPILRIEESEDFSELCPRIGVFSLSEMLADKLSVELHDGECLKMVVDDRVYRLESEGNGVEIGLPTYPSFWPLYPSSPVILRKEKSPAWLRGNGGVTIYLEKE